MRLGYISAKKDGRLTGLFPILFSINISQYISKSTVFRDRRTLPSFSTREVSLMKHRRKIEDDILGEHQRACACQIFWGDWLTEQGQAVMPKMHLWPNYSKFCWSHNSHYLGSQFAKFWWRICHKIQQHSNCNDIVIVKVWDSTYHSSLQRAILCYQEDHFRFHHQSVKVQLE